MDPLIIVLAVLVIGLVLAVRMAGAEKRRRRQGWAAYYKQEADPRRAGKKRKR